MFSCGDRLIRVFVFSRACVSAKAEGIMRRQQYYLRIRSVKSIDPELSGTTSGVVGNHMSV